MSRRLWEIPLLLLAAIGASGACGANLPPLPSRGGRTWFEIESAHFTLWTDTSIRRGVAIANRLELSRQVIAQAMQVEPSKISPTFAIAFEDLDEMQRLAGRSSPAFAWTGTDLLRHQPILVFSVGENDADFTEDRIDASVSHEVAHLVSWSAAKRHMPLWLGEGLAGYFEMMRVRPGSAQFGVPHPYVAEYLRKLGPVSMALLFSDKMGPDEGQFRSTSWAAYSYLLEHHRPRLERFLLHINELPHGSHERAWREAFPSMSPEQLGEGIAGWIRNDKVKLTSMPVTSLSPPASFVRRLSDADVLAMRNLLRLAADGTDASLADASAALALDPTHLLAWWVAAFLGRGPTPAVARALTAAHPGEWRAWTLLQKALPEGGAERAEAHERLCAIVGAQDERCTPSENEKSGER